MNISIAVVADVVKGAEKLVNHQHDKRYLAIEKAARQGTLGALGIVLIQREFAQVISLAA